MNFWYDYVKAMNKEKAKLFYMDTDRFMVYIKTEDIYVDITWDTSNYEQEIQLPKENNKKVIGLMEDELGGKIMA